MTKNAGANFPNLLDRIFSQEFSGTYDLQFVKGSILGIGRKEARKKYDDIFAFAELSKFESLKLKNFSSGMYVRLAFSTAIHAEPNNMLIDEVFAVGDEVFRKKCLVIMAEMQTQGKTIILVYHNLAMIKDLCQRVLLLHDGRIASIGDSDKVISDYIGILTGK